MRTGVLVWGIPLAASIALAQTAGPRSQERLTFSHDVAPILYKHCVSCHHPGDIAPMSLLTYKDARPWAAAIREEVVSRKMPPWLADPAIGHWSNDPRLSDAEIHTIRAWVEGPKLEGDPKDMPAAPSFPDGWKIGKPDAVFSIPLHTLEAKGPDEYTYVDVPTNFKEDRWIVAAELRPGNRRIVHHAHVFVKSVSGQANKPPTPATEYAKWIRIQQGS